MKNASILFAGIAAAALVAGCTSAQDTIAQSATITRHANLTQTDSSSPAGGDSSSGKGGGNPCGSQLKKFKGAAPTSIDTSSLTSDCRAFVKEFAAAYTAMLEGCKSELENVGSRNPIAYIGSLLDGGKASSGCEEAALKLADYLPPGPPPGR